MRIETKDDWWAAAHQSKDDLRHMVCLYHPGETDGVAPEIGPITASTAEMACKLVRDEIYREEAFLAGPLQRFDLAFEKKDWKELSRLFNSTWFGIPESIGAWSIPSFGVLCDLCSENWVFQEADEEGR